MTPYNHQQNQRNIYQRPSLPPPPLPPPEDIKINTRRIFWTIFIFLSMVMVSLISIAIISNNDININLQNLQPKQKYIQAPHSRYDFNKILSQVDSYGILYGDSMYPTYFGGNTVLLRNITKDYEIRAGEIIRYLVTSTEDCEVYERNSYITDSPIIHRVTGIYGDIVITKPDNINIINGKDVIKRCQITHIAIGVLYT